MIWGDSTACWLAREQTRGERKKDEKCYWTKPTLQTCHFQSPNPNLNTLWLTWFGVILPPGELNSRGQNILLSVAKKSSGGDLVAKVSVTKTSMAKLSGYHPWLLCCIPWPNLWTIYQSGDFNLKLHLSGRSWSLIIIRFLLTNAIQLKTTFVW